MASSTMARLGAGALLAGALLIRVARADAIFALVDNCAPLLEGAYYGGSNTATATACQAACSDDPQCAALCVRFVPLPARPASAC